MVTFAHAGIATVPLPLKNGIKKRCQVEKDAVRTFWAVLAAVGIVGLIVGGGIVGDLDVIRKYLRDAGVYGQSPAVKTRSACIIRPCTSKIRERQLLHCWFFRRKRVTLFQPVRLIATGKPQEGWIWQAPTKSGHVEPSTVKKHHKKAITGSEVRPFVLYTLRHTFLTRLGACGCDVWTLARIAGHSSIAMSSRYVHPSEDRVMDAMAYLGGHRIGHTEENEVGEEVAQLPSTS
jgi:Phage integrase family